MGVVLTDEKIETILKEAEVALAPFVHPDGSVHFDSPAHLVSAVKM